MGLGPSIVPQPGQVRVMRDGALLAETDAGVLHRTSYAPDLYIPEGDIAPEGLAASQASALPDLAGLRTFAFDAVEIEVDGTRVRGHMRDPLKTITVEDVPERLEVFVGEARLVDTARALRLHESGLPPRFYVPPADMDDALLAPATRISVCTYKGEARYHHVTTGEARLDHAVWTYAAPWTDFAKDIGRIKGLRGLYTSVMGRVLLNGAPVDAAAEAAADAEMIASPTIDAVLKDKP